MKFNDWHHEPLPENPYLLRSDVTTVKRCADWPNSLMICSSAR